LNISDKKLSISGKSKTSAKVKTSGESLRVKDKVEITSGRVEDSFLSDTGSSVHCR